VNIGLVLNIVDVYLKSEEWQFYVKCQKQSVLTEAQET